MADDRSVRPSQLSDDRAESVHKLLHVQRHVRDLADPRRLTDVSRRAATIGAAVENDGGRAGVRRAHDAAERPGDLPRGVRQPRVPRGLLAPARCPGSATTWPGPRSPCWSTSRPSRWLLSAAAFAVSYLPWLVGGPLLAALAERYPYRRVMIVCDLVRMALIALVALPGLPVAGMLVAAVPDHAGQPAGQAARSALLPLILTGDRLVVGLSRATRPPARPPRWSATWPAPRSPRVNPRLALLHRRADLRRLGAADPRSACGTGRRPSTAAAAQPPAAARPPRASGWSSARRCCARSR